MKYILNIERVFKENFIFLSMADIKEECGVLGIYLKDRSKNSERVPHLLYSGLFELQHRGQLSAGISVYNILDGEYGLLQKVTKKIGSVAELFRINKPGKSSKFFRENKGVCGIGHVRYATSGDSDMRMLLMQGQPMFRQHDRPDKEFSLSYNGQLVNQQELTRRLKRGYNFRTNVDTELIQDLFLLNINRLAKIDSDGNFVKANFFELTESVMNDLDGAYNILYLSSIGDLGIIRDPYGFKPLVWGENEEFYAVASESVALRKIGINNIEPVVPGSAMIINGNGIDKRIIKSSDRRAFCFFEYAYFSRLSSINDGRSVYSVRINLGNELADLVLKGDLIPSLKANPERALVVPVPNTAITAGEQVGRRLGINYSCAALIKSDSERGFINKAERRDLVMSRVYDVIPEAVRGKIVILVDDTIVRGETSRRIVQCVREAGAEEVHMLVTVPPIKHGCFYGVDFFTEELIADKYKDEKLEDSVAKEIGADSVIYPTLDGLVRSTGFSKNELCLACLDGEYPTTCGKAKEEEKRQKGMVI